MVCQNCKKAHATHHYVEIRNKRRKEVHVCEPCAQQLGLGPKLAGVSLPDLFEKFLDPAARKKVKEMADVRCPQCGMSYADFRSRGRFGCARDFEVFDSFLPSLLERMHGAARHIGRVPATAPEDVALRQELVRLRRELEEMTRQENFERCAELRDQIRRIEQRLGSAGAL
jgi:protein arginine kinase activator